MNKIIREPLVHFLLIGAGLFILSGWRGDPPPLPAGQAGPQSSQIVVSQGDVDRLVETFTRTWQRQPSQAETKNLIDSFVRDEIYYREALAVGLHRDDSLIRRRMRLKMEFIFEDIAAQQEPTKDDLKAFFETHAARYVSEAQISFRHVYVDTGKRGADAEADARRILTELKQGVNPEVVGDPFLLASVIRLSSLREIKHQWGQSFADRVLGLEPGRWAGPVPSGFGLHLVMVTDRVGERQPELAEVRDRVKREWAAERQQALKDAAYERLKTRYTVVVEKPETAVSATAEANGGTVIR